MFIIVRRKRLDMDYASGIYSIVWIGAIDSVLDR